MKKHKTTYVFDLFKFFFFIVLGKSKLILEMLFLHEKNLKKCLFINDV